MTRNVTSFLAAAAFIAATFAGTPNSATARTQNAAKPAPQTLRYTRDELATLLQRPVADNQPEAIPERLVRQILVGNTVLFHESKSSDSCLGGARYYAKTGEVITIECNLTTIANNPQHRDVIERHTAHWKDENQSFCLDNEEDPGDFRCGFIKLVATPVKGGLFEIQHAAPTYGDDPLTKPALVVTGNVLNLH